MEVNGVEVVFKEDPEELEDQKEIQMEDLKKAPQKFEYVEPEVTNPMEEVNLGTLEEPRITYVSSLLQDDIKRQIVEVLKEFRDCFAWSYEEMPGLKSTLVEHKLPIKPEFKPHGKPPRRMSKEVELKVKEEIEKPFKAKFIRPTRYAQWLANIVHVIKKNGKLRVCIDFRDLNTATPKNIYVIPIADMLTDVVIGNELLSLVDDFSGYNQIMIDKENVHKMAFRCP